MSDLFRQLLETAQTLLEGMFGFLGVVGRDGSGRLVSAVLLLLLGVVLARVWGSRLGYVVTSFVFASAVFALVRGLGGSAELGTLLGAVIVGVMTGRVALDALKRRSFGWAAFGSILAVMSIFAVLSLTNSSFLDGQLPRDARRMTATIKVFVSNFVDAATDGLKDERKPDRTDKQNRQR